MGPNTLIQAPLLPDGFFYGTSLGGGVGFGSVFKMDAAGNVSTIHSFAGGPTDGKHPKAGLFLNDDGFFYGTTAEGGSDDAGTIFKIDSTGATYSFQSMVCTNTAGAAPLASFFKANDGHLYLPMSICGQFNPTNDYGTLDSVSTSLTATRMHGFLCLREHHHSVGSRRSGRRQRPVRRRWVVRYAPTGFAGGIYRVISGNDVPEAVHLWTGPDGGRPHRPPRARQRRQLLRHDGKEAVASNVGTIFEVTAGGVFSTVHFFNGVDGGLPQERY